MGSTKYTERLYLIGQLVDRIARNQLIVQIFTFYLLMFKTTQDIDGNSTVHLLNKLFNQQISAQIFIFNIEAGDKTTQLISLGGRETNNTLLSSYNKDCCCLPWTSWAAGFVPIFLHPQSPLTIHPLGNRQAVCS